MKSIKLTEKHKSKLLKMCKILFPEYDFRITKPLFSNNESLSTVQFGKKSKTVYGIEIHWFEFSWKLLNEILTVYESSPIITLDVVKKYGIICFNNSELIHPIDWIYKLYNSYKQNFKTK